MCEDVRRTENAHRHKKARVSAGDLNVRNAVHGALRGPEVLMTTKNTRKQALGTDCLSTRDHLRCSRGLAEDFRV